MDKIRIKYPDIREIGQCTFYNIGSAILHQVQTQDGFRVYVVFLGSDVVHVAIPLTSMGEDLERDYIYYTGKELTEYYRSAVRNGDLIRIRSNRGDWALTYATLNAGPETSPPIYSYAIPARCSNLPDRASYSMRCVDSPQVCTTDKFPSRHIDYHGICESRLCSPNYNQNHVVNRNYYQQERPHYT